MPGLTEADIRQVIGKNGFQIEATANGFNLSTRDNGDVGEETPGDADVAEAKRMIPLLRAAFPTYKVTAEVVDEWVHVDITPRASG